MSRHRRTRVGRQRRAADGRRARDRPSERRHEVARALHPAMGLDAAGVEEVAVVDWPDLLRRRRRRRMLGTPRDRRWLTLSVVLAGLFAVNVSVTLLSNSLDRISGELGASRALLTWAIVGPMLAFGVVGPAYGKAGDLWGHKKVYLAGLAGAGVFALASCLAWNGPSLVAFRILSATAGSATGPATMAFVNRLFPPMERVRPLSMWSFVNAGGPVIGVVLGAPLVEAVGWRVIFAVQAPLCLLGVLAAWRLVPETGRQPHARFDVKGALTLGSGVTSVLLAVNRGGDWGWTSPGVVGLVGFGLVMLAVFVRVERQADEPLLPLPWLRRRNLVFPVASITLVNFAYMGGFLLTPTLLQRGLGFSESRSGTLLICRPLVFALVAPLAGLVTVRVGERVSGMAGAASMVASMLVFVTVGSATATWHIALALGLSGLAFGVLSPAMTALVAGAVDERELGVAGAMQQLVSQLGAVLGAEVMESVRRAGEDGGGLFHGFHLAYATGAAAAALAVVTAAAVRPSRRLRR